MAKTAMSKYPLLAVIGVTALSIAACGSSTTGSPTTSSKAGGTTSASSSSAPTSGAPSVQGKDRVSGLIASVSGTTIQVTQQSGTAAVAYSPSTSISEVTAAQLTDVTPGSCVAVRPAGGGQNGGTVTARTVWISPATNGQCRPPRGRGGVSGIVSSVNGNTIVASATDSSGNASQTNIQVSDNTTYAKRAVANSQAIAVGKCVAARGAKDTGGTLQATAINLRPANNGTCPQPNGQHHHQGG
jgi:hypothetical protein